MGNSEEFEPLTNDTKAFITSGIASSEGLHRYQAFDTICKLEHPEIFTDALINLLDDEKPSIISAVIDKAPYLVHCGVSDLGKAIATRLADNPKWEHSIATGAAIALQKIYRGKEDEAVRDGALDAIKKAFDDKRLSQHHYELTSAVIKGQSVEGITPPPPTATRIRS